MLIVSVICKAVEAVSGQKKPLSLREEKKPNYFAQVAHAMKVLLKYRTRANYKDGDFVGARIADKVRIIEVCLILTFAPHVTNAAVSKLDCVFSGHYEYLVSSRQASGQ